MSATTSDIRRARLRAARWRIGAVAALVAALAAASAFHAASARTRTEPASPIRAVFYYPWFPAAWKQQGLSPFTHYKPTLGFYDGASKKVLEQQFRWLAYAGMNAVIASWWGPRTNTDQKVPIMLSVLHSTKSPLKLALYYEAGSGLPPAGKLASDLDYIAKRYTGDADYLHVAGRPVLFVYTSGSAATCSAVKSFQDAAAGRFYLDLKVFVGFRSCAAQPDSWHQYAPAEAVSDQKGYAISISPGFWKANESTPRLPRSPVRWAGEVRSMVASHEPWQLVTTYNEWGEGSAVEPAVQWSSPSGAGAYLDALHDALHGRAVTPTTPKRTGTPKPKPKTKPKSEPKTTAHAPVRPAGGPVVTTRGGTILGRATVGSVLSVELRPAPASTARYSYHWLECDWTGGVCSTVGKTATYRLRTADLGRRIRVLVAPAPHAGVKRLGPTPVVLPANAPPTIAAAGDIACEPSDSAYNGGAGTLHGCAERAVSSLILANHPTAVLALGDTQYECGDYTDYEASFNSSWGRFKPIIHPAIGNHEYGKACHRNDPSGYFQYFGDEAGPKRAWYSYDLGSWHFVVLDSECSYGQGAYQVGGCQKGSAQEAWLRHDLATHSSSCTLAYWHEPRFSSGAHGDAVQMSDLWNDLAAAHVDIVLSGHNHDYERFDPIGATPDSQVQPTLDPSGIREFVVGTGGKNHDRFNSPALDGEVVRNASAFGALFLTLRPDGYTWRFEAVPGGAALDKGSGSCH